MRYLVILSLWCVSLVSPSVWALSFEQLAQHTQTPKALTGHFKQSKYLSAFELELESKGQFHYQQDKSIVWQTLEPVANELILTPDSIVNRQGGQELMRLDAQASPTIAVLSEIFFSVMTADWQRLEQHFSLTGELNEAWWSAQLLPVDESFGQLINRVDLSGDQLLKKVVLHEKSGDTTTIYFSDLQPDY